MGEEVFTNPKSWRQKRPSGEEKAGVRIKTGKLEQREILPPKRPRLKEKSGD